MKRRFSGIDLGAKRRSFLKYAGGGLGLSVVGGTTIASTTVGASEHGPSAFQVDLVQGHDLKDPLDATGYAGEGRLIRWIWGDEDENTAEGDITKYEGFSEGDCTVSTVDGVNLDFATNEASVDLDVACDSGDVDLALVAYSAPEGQLEWDPETADQQTIWDYSTGTFSDDGQLSVYFPTERVAWQLEGQTDVGGEGYAGVGHWHGDDYHVYEFGVGVNGAAAPTGPSDAADQYYWTAADYGVGDTPDDSWDPIAEVDTWEIQSDDDGNYLQLGGPNNARTNLRFTAAGQAAEMDVWARKKILDGGNDVYVYLRGQNEDDPGTMNAARVDDEILGGRNRLSQYHEGGWGLIADMDRVGEAGDLYEVRGRIFGQTVNAKWEPIGGDE